MRVCERCGVNERFSNDAEERVHVGYCAVCSKNLCDSCMAKGCCGNVPAKDGEADDYVDDAE